MSQFINGNTGGGSGDVVGPSSAVADHVATFDGTTGKLIQDGGQTIAEIIASIGAPEGTAVLSTGEAGGYKHLRENGDGTSSWQKVDALSLADAAAGSMIAYDDNGVAQYVADGSAGSFLKSTGGNLPVWGGVAATELSAATAGDIIAFDAGGTPQYVAAGTTGDVLTSQGADLPTWEAPSGGGSGGTVQGTDGTYDLRPTDEGATAGDIRGEYSVDLCTQRSDAAYVCAGTNSGALAGRDIGGTGPYSAYLAGIYNYNNSGSYCAIAGISNHSNSGGGCHISGQDNYHNRGTHSSIAGRDNVGNFGNYCNISGRLSGGTTKILESGGTAEADDNLITSVAHGLVLNDRIKFILLTGGSGLDLGSVYYVTTVSTDTFAVSDTKDGSEVDIDGDYSNVGYIANAANYGSDCLITGEDNHSNTGDANLIAGKDNYKNSGQYCLISGYLNTYNSGLYCVITGRENTDNSGLYTTISGYSNKYNAGAYCSITGVSNEENSGDYTVIGGEFNDTNSGGHCLITGYNNHDNSGNYCTISGRENHNNAGEGCIISGGNNTNNSGSHSIIGGKLAENNNLSYARVHGGDEHARIIDLVAKASTTDDTPTALTLGGGAEGDPGSIIIPQDTAWAFVVHVVALNMDALGNSKKFSFDGLVLNNGGTVTVTSQTLGTNTTIGTFTGTVALSADGTNDALRILATGIAATSIHWTARIELTQVD